MFSALTAVNRRENNENNASSKSATRPFPLRSFRNAESSERKPAQNIKSNKARNRTRGWGWGVGGALQVCSKSKRVKKGEQENEQKSVKRKNKTKEEERERKRWSRPVVRVRQKQCSLHTLRGECGAPAFLSASQRPQAASQNTSCPAMRAASPASEEEGGGWGEMC